MMITLIHTILIWIHTYNNHTFIMYISCIISITTNILTRRWTKKIIKK